MVQSVTYQRETRTVPFQGKNIVLESLTPVLSPIRTNLINLP